MQIKNKAIKGDENMKWLAAIAVGLWMLAIETESSTLMLIGFVLAIFAGFVMNATKNN